MTDVNEAQIYSSDNEEVNCCLPVWRRTENNSVNSANICCWRWALAHRFDFISIVFEFPLILIITIPTAPTQPHDLPILQTPPEVLAMLLDDGLTHHRLLGGQGSAPTAADLRAVLLGLADALADAAM